VVEMSTQPDPFLLAADILDPPDDPDRELAERCTKRLKTFIREAWPIVEPATPFVDGWHIDVVCEHLEAVTAGELPRLLINVPPRTMKSLTVGVFWPAWEWLTAPHVRWLFASYAQDLSQRDSLKCRRLIKSEGGRTDGTFFQRVGYQGVLRLLYSKPWTLTADQDVKNKYETTEMGMRLATSVGGVATGEGGDRIAVDDPLSAKQARSETERVAANTWWDETMTTRFNSARAAAVIVMQRLHEDDLTGHLKEQGGWHHLCLPAEYEPSHPFVYPDRVTLPERELTAQGPDGEAETITIPGGRTLTGDKRNEAGELLEPIRLSADRLAELKRSLGSYGYAGQMQQRPSPIEGGMFKRDWWQYWTPETLPPNWDRLIQSWDMTFKDTESASGSYVVGQVWGARDANRFLLAQVRGKFGFTDTVKAVEALTAAWPYATAILVEEKANGAAVINMLKAKIQGMIPVQPEGGKEARAAAVEPFVEAGNVYLPSADFIPCVPGYEATSVADFIEEHAVFPNGTHDDQVDTLSQGLTWLGAAPAVHAPVFQTGQSTWAPMRQKAGFS
jgi:predicted phage terminase large subunit-like protein